MKSKLWEHTINFLFPCTLLTPCPSLHPPINPSSSSSIIYFVLSLPPYLPLCIISPSYPHVISFSPLLLPFYTTFPPFFHLPHPSVCFLVPLGNAQAERWVWIRAFLRSGCVSASGFRCELWSLRHTKTHTLGLTPDFIVWFRAKR